MNLLRCDGCGLSEAADTPQKRRKVRTIRLAVVHDPRDIVPDEQHVSDLCDTCQGTLLHTYFNVLAEGNLQVPAFLPPTTREREFAR